MRRLFVACLIAAAWAAGAHAARAQTAATLYFSQQAAGKKADYSRAFISFRTGEVGGNELGENADLAFGLLQISHEDWFKIENGRAGRSVIRDLGERTWADVIEVPALAPLPELKPGEPPRVVTIDSSGDTHQKWAKTTPLFAKVRAGHVYAVRVVRGGTDLYVLFRVEAHEQGKSCAISWRIAPAPAEAADGRVR